MRYPQLLAALWAQAHADRTADAPTVVSTFAGCGGSSLGYAMAGYRELLAVEWDKHAGDVFSRNFPDVPLHLGDIHAVDPARIGLAQGELDLFDGSPPCQGFSTSGKRQIDDPRNQLFRQYVRLLRAWMPKTFVMENVASMAQGRMIPLFQEILGELRACGYKVIARVLDASYLGAPQARKRMIIIGVRNDLPFLPVHPRPSLPRRTVRDAFEGLPRDDPQAPRPGGKLGRLTARIPQGRRGADVLKNTGLKASYYNTIRLHWDQPSRTICKLWAPGRAGELYPDQERYVGVRELSRLQGFPDEFDWGRPAPGRPYHRWYADVHARIGNSVPPLMSYAIASTLRTAVLEPARSKEAA